MTDKPEKTRSMRKLSRREVLAGAAAAATAPYVLTSGALGAAGLAPASDRITVACVGVRNKGGGHLKSLLSGGTAQVVAVCDVDRTVRRRAANRIAGVYKRRWSGAGRCALAESADFREIAARDDVDAVVVATPDHTHAVIALEMLRSGRNVFVEKPVSLTVREGRALADAAVKSGLVVQVGSQRRSNPKYQRLQSILRGGAIGRLMRVEINLPRRAAQPMPWSPEPVPAGLDYDAWLGPAPWVPYAQARCHYNWRFITDYSGGELTGPAWHAIDLALWAADADADGPVVVEGRGESHPAGLYDAFYHVDVRWALPGGVKILCRTGAPAGTRFVGTDGWIEAETFRASSPGVLMDDMEPDKSAREPHPASDEKRLAHGQLHRGRAGGQTRRRRRRPSRGPSHRHALPNRRDRDAAGRDRFDGTRPGNDSSTTPRPKTEPTGPIARAGRCNWSREPGIHKLSF